MHLEGRVHVIVRCFTDSFIKFTNYADVVRVLATNWSVVKLMVSQNSNSHSCILLRIFNSTAGVNLSHNLKTLIFILKFV